MSFDLYSIGAILGAISLIIFTWYAGLKVLELIPTDYTLHYLLWGWGVTILGIMSTAAILIGWEFGWLAISQPLVLVVAAIFIVSVVLFVLLLKVGAAIAGAITGSHG